MAAAVVAVREGMSNTRDQLETLVRIPSISADGHPAEEVRRSADAVAALLTELGLDNVRLLEVEGAHPYVAAEWLHAPDAPTVLLYAHHDVQPVGTPDRWHSEPFEPTERDGRLFGRGTADDKAGVLVHVAAIGAWLRTAGTLPINVKVIVEGEEEIGSPHLPTFLRAHAEELRADVIVLTDLPNWKIGWPALTFALRGMGELYVTVETLEQPVHSGMYGGPIPDALTALIRMLATLHNADGTVAVAGFADDVLEPSAADRELLARVDADEGALRTEARLLDGVEFIGDPACNVLERTWMQPTITPVGIDVPDVVNASNQLIARARAKLSCRFAPGQDPDRALATVISHLEANAPWGVRVQADLGHRNAAWVTSPTGPAFDAAEAAMTAAYGRAPAYIGCGGSIPFVQPFAEAFGGAPCLLTGIEDPHTNAHGEDESLHLDDFANACETEVRLLAELAERLG